MFEVHLDNNLRHRLGMAANLRDFFVGQRLSFFAKQLTTARERNRLGPRICTINELHGAPLEREFMTIRVVLVALQRAGLEPTRRCPWSADAGVTPSNTRDVVRRCDRASSNRAIDQVVLKGAAP
jgi:hypothetical protein